MSRKAIYIILLCLLPMLSFGQTLTRLEYWFDDNFSSKRAVNLSGTEYEVDTSISTQGLNNGVHKLWYRVRRSDGMYSPVSGSLFYKFQFSDGMKLEYWVDDDYEHAQTFDGRLASDGKDYIFVNELDLGNVTPGHHRLHCRAITSDDQAATAITSMPIIVKSLYNVGNPEELTVTEQAYWFDDEEPEVISVAYPDHDIVQPTTFDTRRLTDGKHTLHMRFGNSAGIWNGPVDAEFTKTKVVDPEITATACVEDGVVKLAFNAVPNGYSYTIVRRYPSGTIRKIKEINGMEYPADLKTSDTPAPGTYTYYVDGHYRDINDKPQKVTSNEITVTVEQAASTVKHGSIHGVLTFNGKSVSTPFFIDYFVFVNGNSVYNTDYNFHKDYFGEFKIGNIPYGTEITIGVQSGLYGFREKTVVVDENTSTRTYCFNGDSNENILPDNSTYDLMLYDKVHITPTAWELDVMNKSNLPWKGYIDIMVISKKAKDNYDKAMRGEDTSFWEDVWGMFGSKANYEDVPLYTEAASSLVSLEGKERKVFSLDITNLPESDKNEEYYVYLFTRKEGTELTKELEGTNPQVLKFNPFDYEVAALKGFKAYMKEYATVMKWMKKFTAWGDPFKLAWKSGGKAFDNYIKSLEDGEVDMDELNEDVADVAISSAGMLLNCLFKDMHKAIKMHAKSIKETEIYKIHEKIESLYSLVNGAYSATHADDTHQFFELARLVLKYSKQLGADPVLDCYKTFFEVGEAMAGAAERLSNTISNAFVWDRLVNGNGIYNIKIRRCSSSGGYAGYFPGWDYYHDWTKTYLLGDYHYGQIENIEIKLVNPINNVTNTSKPIGTDNITLTEDGITIKNVKFKNPSDFQTTTEAWMTIKWKNKRVTQIPLLDENFVKIENFNKDVSVPLIMTVEFQSGTYMNKENIPNNLTFVEP